MTGLLVWAQSYCRSTLAFYEGLATAFGVPIKVLVWHKDTSIRTAMGFSDDEFSHLDLIFIENDETKALEMLYEYRHWHQIFGTYQKGLLFRKMLVEANRLDCQIAIASEAPCNMLSPPFSLIKTLYILHGLRFVVSKQIQASDYIINYSGDRKKELINIGWSSKCIIECGYYPPPLVGSLYNQRDTYHWKRFKILMTGCHEWHRNPMILLYALKELKRRNILCETIITQNGPFLPRMMRYAKKHNLNVEFSGLVSYKKLIHLYETCSCFVATGRAEPWGIRVNDALNCGAPIIVSEGMGSVKLVNDHGCGLSFLNNNSNSLADKLQSIIMNENHYLELVKNVRKANDFSSPKIKAKQIVSEIQKRFPNWN
jgi:glycosyltransferase involved in cell wall biosynthesis